MIITSSPPLRHPSHVCIDKIVVRSLPDHFSDCRRGIIHSHLEVLNALPTCARVLQHLGNGGRLGSKQVRQLLSNYPKSVARHLYEIRFGGVGETRQHGHNILPVLLRCLGRGLGICLSRAFIPITPSSCMGYKITRQP